jgi:N-acyl-D-aspartate/D-glutamate deacylase
MKSNRSVETLLKNLEKPEWLAEIRDDIKTGRNVWLGPMWGTNIDANITILRCDKKEYENRTLRDIMTEKGWDMAEAIVNVFKSDPYTSARLGLGVMFAEEWIEEMFRHPQAMPSGDNTANNLDTDYGIESPIALYPHQNAYCYAIKYLTVFSKHMSLEEAVKRITEIPAAAFGIGDRGVLHEGKVADIVVFTPEELKTNEDFIDPRKAPDGINYVIVNGVLTVENKKHTGARAGRFLLSKKPA